MSGEARVAPSRVNVANGLTLLRLLLVPVFGVLLLHGHGTAASWRYAALGVYVVASVTDRVDGQVARARGLVTDLGKIADPIADKALAGVALVGLSVLGSLAWWVTVVVLAREIGITLLRFAVLRYGVIAASRGGKAKTLLQAIAIGLYVLPLTGVAASVRGWVMAVAVVVTLVTGFDYLMRAWRLRSVARAAGTAGGRR